MTEPIFQYIFNKDKELSITIIVNAKNMEEAIKKANAAIGKDSLAGLFNLDFIGEVTCDD